HRAGTAHVSRCADVASCAAEAHAQVGHAVMERRRLAAVFVVIVEHGHVIDIIVLQRYELAVARGAEANTLLSARPMADRLEHHLATDDQLHRSAYLPGRGDGKRNVRPRIKLAAESRAKKL